MDQDRSSIAAFILAGGKSMRMGRDKAFVGFEGRTLLERALETARSVTPSVRIVSDAEKFGVFAGVVQDVFHGCGPLAGIHAALRVSDAELNLMLAVDMPFVSAELLRFLLARARESTAIVTVPCAARGWQPLCAVYRREFAAAAEKALRAGRYKIDALFDAETTRSISDEELAAASFSGEIFRNMNTPEELAVACGNAKPIAGS